MAQAPCRHQRHLFMIPTFCVADLVGHRVHSCTATAMAGFYQLCQCDLDGLYWRSRSMMQSPQFEHQASTADLQDCANQMRSQNLSHKRYRCFHSGVGMAACYRRQIDRLSISQLCRIEDDWIARLLRVESGSASES
jgi:hypothetical protein